MSRDWRLHLQDIGNACEKIQRHVSGMTRSDFEGDEKTVDAVIRNLEIIGESAKRIPESELTNMPKIDWRRIKGMRDILAHEHFGIDSDILWM